MRSLIVASCLSFVLVPFAWAPVAAQETRASTIAEAQAEKAARLKPYVPTKAERIAAYLQERLFQSPNGFYPWLDSVYGGGGFTLGAGYRRFYGDRTFWVARGLFSLKAYKLAEFGTVSLGLGKGHVNLQGIGGWRDATQVAFYGVGGDTTVDGKTNYRMKQGYLGAAVRARGPGLAVFDLGFQYEDFTLESGHGSGLSIEDLYTPDSAPGLGANPSYLHMTMSAGIDSRPSAGYARRGGLYAVTYEGYIDPDATYSFDRLQGEAVQHLPILRESWVVSLHGVVRTTLGDTDIVPYFLLPSLGSGSTLRGYPSWRFRDRHSLLMSAELRWIPSRMFLDMALFYDAGKVTSHGADLDFADLSHDIGVGMRIHTPLATPVRIELARGSEGFNLVFSGGAAF